jgi:hypothetical protein
MFFVYFFLFFFHFSLVALEATFVKSKIFIPQSLLHEFNISSLQKNRFYELYEIFSSPDEEEICTLGKARFIYADTEKIALQLLQAYSFSKLAYYAEEQKKNIYFQFHTPEKFENKTILPCKKWLKIKKDALKKNNMDSRNQEMISIRLKANTPQPKCIPMKTDSFIFIEYDSRSPFDIRWSKLKEHFELCAYKKGTGFFYGTELRHSSHKSTLSPFIYRVEIIARKEKKESPRQKPEKEVPFDKKIKRDTYIDIWSNS